MKKEIEVKAKVKNIQSLISRLSALGVSLSEPARQVDGIYTNFPDKEFADFKPGVNFLRIRKSGDKILFTLKQSLVNELEGIEKELEINNEQEMEDILILMGYHKAVEVIKVRRKTKYKDYEICLDEVETLGSFIEVEKITDEDSEQVQNEMFSFLMSLGVDKEDRVLNGYDTLVYLSKQDPT
ncbi:MAG: class IV adenylate cyclase [bacterium]|nr:class IV adenylate cyclase [bacterium]